MSSPPQGPPSCVEFDCEQLEPRLSLEIPGRVDAITPAVDEVLEVHVSGGWTFKRVE